MPSEGRASEISVLLAGLSYRTATLHALEELSRRVSPEWLSQRLGEALGDVGLGVLSTCNRLEVYLAVDAPRLEEAAAAVSSLLEGGVASAGGLYLKRGREAVRHLIAVACGLDSLALGEPQILQQVRSVRAQGRGMHQRVIRRLFAHAYASASRIRNLGGIDGSLNVGGLAARLLGSRLRRDEAVLVVGAGAIARATVEELLKSGFSEIHIATRNPSHVSDGLRSAVRSVAGLGDLPGLLCSVRAAVVAVSSSGYVIDSDTLSSLPEGHRITIVDLSIPRCVDPGLSGGSVELYNLLDLESYIPDGVGVDEEKTRGLIGDAADAFLSWLSCIHVEEIVKVIRERAEKMRLEELSRTMRLLSGDIGRDAAALDILTRRIVNKLLHTPTTRLREASATKRGELYIEVARELFGVE